MESKRQRSDFPLYALLSASAAIVAIIYAVSLSEAVNFVLYFGSVPPIAATVFICLAGLVAFYALHQHVGLPVYEPSALRSGFPVAAILVIPFAIVVTISDIAAPFPADMNVAMPAALVFYPAIGYVAQIVLHVVPFALFIAIGDIVLGALERNVRLWLSTILASMFEPVFHVMASTGDDRPALATLVMAVSLFLFGVVELQLYRRYDYATMLLFRMLYYCYWHLVWGSLRLHWLF